MKRRARDDELRAAKCARVSPQMLFVSALAVLLSKSGWLREQDTLLRLLKVSTATHAVVLQWLHQTFPADISMGVEEIPVPVCGGTAGADNIAALRAESYERRRHSTQDLLELLGFKYAVQCKFPIPSHQHSLSPEGTVAALRSEVAQSVLCGRHVHVAVQKYQSRKGWAVLAAQDIPRGAYIGEYTGDIVSTRQMQARFAQREALQTTMNYVLMLRERASRPSDEGESGERASFSALRTIVDATDRGCFTRLINHSCEPNLALTSIRLRSLIPHLVLLAQRDIAQGEELSFDYGGGGSTIKSAHGSSDEEVVTSEKEEVLAKSLCLCGAACCRGLLPSDASV